MFRRTKRLVILVVITLLSVVTSSAQKSYPESSVNMPFASQGQEVSSQYIPQTWVGQEQANFINGVKLGYGDTEMWSSDNPIFADETTPTIPGDPTSDPPIGAIPIGDGILVFWVVLAIYIVIKERHRI